MIIRKQRRQAGLNSEPGKLHWWAAEANKTTRAGYQLNSPKELWYYKIFKELFPRDSYEEQVARWDPYK